MPPAVRVFFVNRFYWPDEPATAQLLTDLTETLAAQGFDVSVIARHSLNSAEGDTRRAGVRIVRVKTSPVGARGLLARMLDFQAFARGVEDRLRGLLKPGDIVVGMTDPPLLCTRLTKIAARQGARYVQWVQDIFPEVACAVGGLPMLPLVCRGRDRAWKAARMCVTPGEDMTSFVVSRGIARERVTVCENWAPEGVGQVDPLAWRAQHGLTDKFVVMYSGNLGRVHDFGAIVPLARMLQRSPRLQFVFVGSGARKRRLEAQVSEASLPNVTFLPSQPRAVLSHVLSAADVHLITLREGCERFVFPSKLYGIAAVGRPTVIIGPEHCEPARLARTHGFGDGFSSNSVDSIAAFLTRLQNDLSERVHLAGRARAFGADHIGPSRAAATWMRVFESITASDHTRSFTRVG